jgi:hypothetical protein
MTPKMTDSGIYEVEPDHMTAFGCIVQHFARHEYLMQSVMCMLLKIPNSLSNVALVTSGLGYTGKRDALLSLLRDVDIDASQRERIRWFMGELHKHNQLRNHVAHSMWKAGERPGSIKPLGANPRGGKAKFVGHDPNEPDYLLDELTEIADELGRNFDGFRDYLDSVGLMTPWHGYRWTDSTKLGSFFLTLATRALTGQHVMRSAG